MKKNLRSRRIDYGVVSVLKKKKVPSEIKKDIKRGLKAIQNYLKIKKKPKIYFSDKESENLAEYWGIKKSRPIIVIYTKSLLSSSDDCKELTIKTIIHEYLHYFFDKKKLSKIFDISTEEELIERIEEDVWKGYFC
jgi:hypothetical protein